MIINFNLGMITGALIIVIMSGTLTPTGDIVAIFVCLVLIIIASYRDTLGEE